MKARTRRPKSGYACWNVPNDGAYRGKTQRILRELRGAYRVRMRGTDSITEFSRRARPLPRLGYNATTPTSGPSIVQGDVHATVDGQRHRHRRRLGAGPRDGHTDRPRR